MFIIFVLRYLPVYLWKDRQKRAGKNIFLELLRVLAKRQELDIEVGGARGPKAWRLCGTLT